MDEEILHEQQTEVQPKHAISTGNDAKVWAMKVVSIEGKVIKIP